MTLEYIDNNFYLIPAKEAKRLSVDGQLPSIGYQKAIVLDRLQGMLGKHSSGTYPLNNTHLRSGWLQHTVVSQKQVLALVLFYSRTPTV